MNDPQKINELLRADKDARRVHNLICDTLKKKDFIFADLMELAQSWDVFFVFHKSPSGTRQWAVMNPLSIDKAGRLKMPVVHKIISVPLETLLKTGDDKKDLFRQEFEFAHELGHIVFFEENDSARWLDCPFMRLSASRKCPYNELRAFAEGIKILEDILEKYDNEIKTKLKVKKFFRRIYLSPEYRENFSSDCVISLEEGKIALKEESDFCPMLSRLKEVLTRLNY